MLQSLLEPTGELAQLVKFLPRQGEDLGFLLRTFVKRQMCVLRIPAPERWRNADPWALWEP